MYYNSKIAQDNIVTYCERLITRIQSIKGYDEHYKVLFVNNDPYNIYDTSYIEAYDHKYIIANMKAGIPNHFAFKDFLKYRLVFAFEEPSSEEIDIIKATDEYKQMNNYPNDNSIRIINNVIAVKFNE